MQAPDLLRNAAAHLENRAAVYDSPSGERSMRNTVALWRVLTGRHMSETEGWLFMLCLKLVRARATDKPHTDSWEDAIAYVALAGESECRKS